MLPAERKDGSPRFGRLHLPVGLWIQSPKKHLAKMSRRWPSAASVKSASSDTGRASDTAEPRAGTKAKAARHKRLSNLFHRGATTTVATPSAGNTRWSSEKKLAELAVPDNNSRLAQAASAPQQPPPGILKIFGGELSRGANYKSVLATPRSTARQLVREALERYGLPAAAGTFVLCDVVGRPAGPGGAWQPEHARPVGDAERPLVLQDVWKPKAGCSRRFEIRRRRDVERDDCGDDDEAPGAEAPARRTSRSRSRAASGGPVPPERPDNPSLRRSISDMNLSARRRRERRAVLSVAGDGDVGDGDGTAGTEVAAPAEPSEPEEAPEEMAPARPPRRHPYFLLLQSCDPQALVIHPLTRPRHVFGRRPDKSACSTTTPAADTLLEAPDLLARHCVVRTGDPPLVRPLRGAAVTHNGRPLLRQAPLQPGDLLGLGRHVLLLYKDPRDVPVPEAPAWVPRALPPPPGALGCAACGRSGPERQAALRAFLESRRAELRFRPQDEEPLLREILRLADGDNGDNADGDNDGDTALAPAFLLGLCLEHSARAMEPAHLPALLARVARRVQEAAWEKIKEISDRQPENHQEPPAEAPGDAEVTSELRPLMLWLANATELLNLAQGQVLELEKELEAELDEPGQDALLAADLETCDEALGVLDEVIMSTFQQCVYYLTKTLYATLPALLDSNPFAGPSEPCAAPPPDVLSPDAASPGETASASLSAGEAVSPDTPAGLQAPLRVFAGALRIARACRLHPQLLSQTFGYLFFFCNAALFNTLMERGSAGPFFQWARAVRIRTNLDLLLDWLQAVGLGDIGAEFFRKLSATANLLCTPRGTLAKATWARLRGDYPTLTPAQLHHVLSHYQLGPGRGYPECWTPPAEEREEIATGDIFESFTEHPPLLLPSEGFRLRLGETLTDEGLFRRLCRLRCFLWELEQGALPANQRGAYSLEAPA